MNRRKKNCRCTNKHSKRRVQKKVVSRKQRKPSNGPWACYCGAKGSGGKVALRRHKNGAAHAKKMARDMEQGRGIWSPEVVNREYDAWAAGEKKWLNTYLDKKGIPRSKDWDSLYPDYKR